MISWFHGISAGPGCLLASLPLRACPSGQAQCPGHTGHSGSARSPRSPPSPCPPDPHHQAGQPPRFPSLPREERGWGSRSSLFQGANGACHKQGCWRREWTSEGTAQGLGVPGWSRPRLGRGPGRGSAAPAEALPGQAGSCSWPQPKACWRKRPAGLGAPGGRPDSHQGTWGA